MRPLAEIANSRMRIRRSAKAFLVWFLTFLGVLIYHAGLTRLVAWLHRRAPKILMYHGCEHVESEFTRGLAINTTPHQFNSHLEFLGRHYRLVPLSRLAEASLPDYAVAITFDDGLRSVYTHAWPLLRIRDFPATCCLTTEVIGNHKMIWFNELNAMLYRHGKVLRPIVADALEISPELSVPELINAARLRFSAESNANLMRKLRLAVSGNPDESLWNERLYLDWEEVAEMSRAGFTFANHTRSHPMLANLEPALARAEISDAGVTLAGSPGACEILAYPFGDHDATTVRIARDLGYRMLLEVEGTNWPLDLSRLGRIKVDAVSCAVLFARMEVVEPAKAALKRMLRWRRNAPGITGSI